MVEVVIGIDVGTGSARAGVFDLAGNRLGKGETPTRIWRPAPDFVEQSSDDIWQAVCRAVGQAVALAGPGLSVAGIGCRCWTVAAILVDHAAIYYLLTYLGRNVYRSA